MPRHKYAIISLAAVSALVLGCSRHSSSPVSPSTAAPATTAAEAGVTLKVSAPAPQSPVNDARPENSPPRLTANAAALKFADGNLQYRFQLFNDGGSLVQDGLVGDPSFQVTASLDFDKRYTWRVRAEYQGAAGPWSATASFITPVGAYLHGNELFDPLYNGQTIGSANDVTFVPGVGVRLNSRESFVEWQLGSPLTDGEFSFEATNIGNGSEDWKTKIMSMLQGNGVNITDNPYRLTVDKRPNVNGWNAAVRYTLRSGGKDAGEPNCGGSSWSRSNIYFWRYTWGGGQSNITVLDGGVNGSVKKSCGGSYSRVYQPNPHLVRLGSVRGRAGSESLPGVTIWNVWVSGRSRPPLPNDQ